jgi:Flp pilus assembly protein CpaB
VRNWRVLTAIVAVVLAALAGVLVWKYTDDQKQQAKEPFEFVTVLKAKSRVPANTSFDRALDAELIVADEEYVRRDAPPSYVDGAQDPANLKKQFSEKVMSHDIPEGSVIVAEDLVSVGETRSGLAGQLTVDEKDVGKNNAQALTILLDDTRAVGGFLSPGDRVNVIATVNVTGETNKGSKLTQREGQKPGPVKTTAHLLPGIKVLAVGSTTTSAATQAAATGDGTTTATTPPEQRLLNRGMITLEVTPHQALQIVHAIEVGKLTLTLNPSTFKAGEFTNHDEIVDAVNVWDYETPLTNRIIDELQEADATPPQQ